MPTYKEFLVNNLATDENELVNFVTCLHGKEGLDSIASLTLAEVKLLEQIESYTEKRAALDADYADKLGNLHAKIKLGETNEYTNGSLIVKAWKMYLSESENKAITISHTAKQLSQLTLPQIKKLHASKKDLCEKFKQFRIKLNREFDHRADEVNRFCNIYRKTLEEATKIKEKLDRLDFKNSKDWHKSKERFDKVSRKLHMTHNDYFLSIEAANRHQINYHKELYPFVLQSMQIINEEYVQIWKDVILDIQLNTSWCRKEFTTSEKEVEQSIIMIQPYNEYLSFIKSHKLVRTLNIPFMFDDNLVVNANATSGLTSVNLALNDLTHEQLTCKKISLENTLDDLNITLKMKNDVTDKNEKTYSEMKDTESKAVFSTIDQHYQCRYSSFEAKEVECMIDVLKVQSALVEDAVYSMEESGPQPYLVLDQPTPPMRSSNSNIDQVNVKERRTTLPRLINKLRPKSEASNIRKGSPKNGNGTRVSVCSVGSEGSYEKPIEVLENASWFHGKIDRKAVLRLLTKEGDFIVREKSDGSGEKVLSVKWGKPNIKHFILKQGETGLYTLEGRNFCNIPALITYYYDQKVAIQNSTGICLLNPIPFVYDDYNIPRSNVILKNQLGSGHFGDVFRGILSTTHIEVAVKTCKENVCDVVKKKFLEEAEIMKPCVHENVVKLIGVCEDCEPYYILLEMCDKGDLLGLLKREGMRFGSDRLFSMAADVAKGMEYLEQKQIIHRDLAARNCLVTKDLVVKVSDFGMSREEDDEGIYTIQNTKEIPFKWCAPEVWHYTRFSIKTDVWSYGVTLYEIYSLGQSPYPGWNNKQARDQIDAGYRMPAPENTPMQIYNLMQSCWQLEETRRPFFSDIVTQLEQLRHVLVGT